MTRSRVTFATIDAAAIAALFVSPSTTARCSGAAGPSWNPSTRHASAGGGRAVEAVAVDVRRGDHPHADAGCATEDSAEELLTVCRGDLLRVVQRGERAHAMVAQAVVVEQDAGDHERPGQRASARRPASSAPATKRAPSFRS